MDEADLPRSWIPLDLDAGNVLVDNNSVRFIDLDDSRIGAAPLALSTLLRRLRRMRDGLASTWIDAVQRAYEHIWEPPLALHERWPDLETASVLLECCLGWQRLSQKTERGEVHGALGLAATSTAQRLVRALDGGRDAHGSR